MLEKFKEFKKLSKNEMKKLTGGLTNAAIACVPDGKPCDCVSFCCSSGNSCGIVPHICGSKGPGPADM